MKKRIFPVAVFAVATFLATGAVMAGELIRLGDRFEGAADYHYQGYAVTTDRSGNVIVAGEKYLAADSNKNFFAVKYSPDLSEVLGSIEYDGGFGDDYANGVATDGSGNIIVTGIKAESGYGDIFTIKYDPALTTILSSACVSRGTGYDWGQRVAVDASGNIVVAACYDTGTLITKYNAALTQTLSSATYAGVPTALAIDGDGNIVVGCDTTVVKFAPSLAQVLGTTTVPGAGIAGLAIDASGNIYAAGDTGTGGIFAAKYDAALTQVTSSTTYADSDSGIGVEVDARGNILVGGAYNDNYIALKYSPDFLLVSSATFIVEEHSLSPYDMALDSEGNMCITGYRQSSYGEFDNIVTVKYLNRAPAVTSVAPASAKAGESLWVAVNGADFYTGARLSFGADINVVSAVRTRASLVYALIEISSNAAAGARTVALTNIDGESGAKASAFLVASENQMQGSVDPAQDTILTLEAACGDVTAEIPPQTFGQSVTLSISTAPLPAVPGGQASSLCFEVVNDASLQPLKEIVFTINYRDADVAGFDEEKLTVARYDPARNAWVAVPSVVFPELNRIIARITHLSRFAVVQSPAAAPAPAAGLRVYPNPYDPRNGALTFSGLAGETEIRIFNVTGDLARELRDTDSDGMVTWDGRNAGGSTVASGIYLAILKSPRGKKTIKIAVEK